MSIPWMPKEVSSRLYEKEHELENVKTTYLMSTAFAGGFLAREDGRRPSWFNRVKIMPVTTLTPDLQEHLANACHVICMKVRQEVTSEPALQGARADKPPTGWQAGLLCARVLWRTLFATAASKAPISKAGAPVLFMASCESLKQACKKLLTQTWLETQLQFTSKVSKYRNIKSRPNWSVLEEKQFEVFSKQCGFGLHDPSTTAASSAGSKPASGLQDWLEEVLALRFAIDWLSASMQDAQDFIDQQTRRLQKKPAPRTRLAGDPVEAQLMALKEKSVDSFAMMWTDDAELRGVASLVARLFDGLEGPSALYFAATFTSQMLLALWKGVEPLLAHQASMGIARIAESHAVTGTLPPPQLHELDADKSQSAGFDLVALSYGTVSKDCKKLVSALPRGVLMCIVKVQTNFRGYLFRARNFVRARSVAAYCQAAKWPQLYKPQEGFDEVDSGMDDKKDRKRRKKVGKKVDAKQLQKEITDFQPAVSKYHGGDPSKAASAAQARTAAAAASSMGFNGTAAMGSTMGTMAGRTGMGSTMADMNPDRRSWPLPTADHRACADLFALYMYNMYRRRELTRMWATLCGSYERGMDTYAELLNKNPALKPMLESIAAQLKRGSVVGYDKAFIAKQRKESDSSNCTGRNPAADMFASTRGRGGGQKALGQTGMDATTLPKGGTGPISPLPKGVGLAAAADNTKDADLSGEYLTNYLREMDGDDSQFKDIVADVIPLSTGTSPPRVPAHEHILQQETAAQSMGSPSDKPKKPKLDVPFCIKRVKPLWLPIKAHRFAAYRAKVLQLLPQRVLQQYIDFEKQGQYAACITLLESATPGSLNVLRPASLVNNKPLLIETVLQLIVGYSGLCLKNNQGPVAVKLITQVIDNMSLSLRDLHPGHRTVLEAYLYDTALSICYYMPQDIGLTDRSEAFFQQASERYLRLNHTNRYCKCCLRAAAVLQGQGHLSEAEYYTQQALNKLSDAPVSSLLAVCYHNLAVHTIVQKRLADSVAHVRSYVALLRQLPKLGNNWMQQMDDTQWLILKAQEMWPQFQMSEGMRDGQVTKFGH